MSTEIKTKRKTRAELHAQLLKRIGKSKFKSAQDFINNAGLWEGRKDITIEATRERAWKRS